MDSAPSKYRLNNVGVFGRTGDRVGAENLRAARAHGQVTRAPDTVGPDVRNASHLPRVGS